MVQGVRSDLHLFFEHLIKIERERVGLCDDAENKGKQIFGCDYWSRTCQSNGLFK